MTEVDDLTRRVGAAIRTERLARDLSLGDLARTSGLSKSLLARLEAEGGNPSLETLQRISKALAIPLAALLTEPAAPLAHKIAPHSGRHIVAEDGMESWLVHADGRSRRTELFEIEFDAGLDHRSAPHLPATEELVLCRSGRMRVGPIDHEIELKPGESAVFSADVPHRYEALRESRILCWILYAAA